MEDELSTDAIGVQPRSESGDVSQQNESSNTQDRSESEIILTSHETGCPQTNNQNQSETLNKTFQSEDTNTARNDNNIVSSDDLMNHDYRTSQNVRNVCGLSHNDPKSSEEYEVKSGSPEPKIRTPDKLKQTHDKNAPDHTLSNLKLPYEHLEIHQTCLVQTNIQSQSETFEKTFKSANSNVNRNENNLHPNHDDGSQNIQNAIEFRHVNPKMAKELEINSESTEPNILSPEEVEQTHDKDAFDQSLSNLKCSPEHLGTQESGCPQTNIQSQSETLANTHAIRIENNPDTKQKDRRQNILTASGLGQNHFTYPAAKETYTRSTNTKQKSPDEVRYDKKVLDQASSNLILPPEPPLEWHLNELLDDIAMEIDDSEFKRIKLMFTSPESLGEKLLNQCDTCTKLFTVLKQKKYISRDNILYLNKILYILGRRDLIKRCVRYCSEEGNVIHYYSYDGKPESGTRYVKIHVVADVRNYNKETLDQLRYYVANLVCAPIEVIKINAVEPGSSFLITLSMPDTYVDVLKDLLQENVNLWKLSSLQVDIIIVDDIHYDVSGHSGARMVSEQYIQIRNVYEQLNDKRKELEQLEITNLQCMEEFENLKTQLESTEKLNHELTTTCSMLQKMHLTFSVTDRAFGGFRSLMQEASEKGQDMGLIKRLINSNTEITAAYHQSVNEMKQELQNLKLKERKTTEQMLLRDLSLNLKSAEEILHTKYTQHTLDINVKLNSDRKNILYGISETLTDEERDKLMKTLSWSKNDVVKACIEADKSLLLLGLECKQAEQTQNQVDTVKFLSLLGEQIGKDLQEMYNEIAEQKRKQDEEEKRNKLHLQLLKQLSSKSKSPEEIILSYAESFSFRCTIKTKGTSRVVPAAFIVQLMIPKSEGLNIFLNEEECTKLLSTCTWCEQDVIKECVNEDRRLLFLGLLCKEMERIEAVIQPEKLIKRIQKQIGRTDLLGLFIQMETEEKCLQVQIERWNKRKTMESQLHKMLSSGKTTAGEVLHMKLKKYTLKLDDDIESKHFEMVAQLLVDLSGNVGKKEQSELIDLYEWGENDIIKACIATDEKLLFEGLWCKEMDITQIMPTIETFLSSICLKINREDIVDQFRANIELQTFDDKVFHHVFSRAADFCVPIMENMFEKLLPVKNATESPPFRTESTNAYYVQLFAGNNPYADLLPD